MFLLIIPMWCFFVDSFCYLKWVYHAFLSVLCSLVVNSWQRAGLFSLLCVTFYCVFVTFPCGVLGQVWYLIVSISDLCLLSYIAMLITKLNMICLVYSDKVFVFMCVHYLSLFCCVLTMLALCHPMKSWESLCPCHLLAPLNRSEGRLKGGLASM